MRVLSYAYSTVALAPLYERDPIGPGQAFAEGPSAHDYATRELAARTRPTPAGWTDAGLDTSEADGGVSLRHAG